MKIETGINPNCSEATIRIALKGQKEAQIEALKAKLVLELNNDHDEHKLPEWDDDKKSPEFEFSEGYVSDKNIFGMRVLEISGDAPYNFGDEIEKIIHRYLPKAEIEYSE
jgi:hypothetical protein